ncbi:MAG TPA: OmpA family protein [Candidatus Kapabacteria bacterium]|nr:OmpA family protein [Candidatus Kapabacteria bacterium]
MVRNLLKKTVGYSTRLTAGAVAFAFLAIALSTPNSFAQKGGTGIMNNEVTWPTTFTLGFGAAANDNWNGSGGYNPDPSGQLFTQSSGLAAPEFHILAEIPIAQNLMFAPRIAYNDYSVQWKGIGAVAPENAGLVISETVLGADLLFKYALSNFHIMAGANLSTPLHMRYAYGSNISDASNPGTGVPNESKFLAGLKGGLGYDIPLNGNNTIWLTPEVFYTYSVTNYVHNTPATDEFFPVTLTGGASLKFALAGPPAAPPPAPIAATITAHGIMPDGSLTADLVSPQQALHTRASIPLLPYIFFDDGSAVISTRYNRSGATGFNEQTDLSGKDALDANHDVLDVIGERMKANPSMTCSIVGTNSNSGDERHNTDLSKARANAVADYLKNTWGIDPGRITVDQRDLPELPTNPVTKAGIEENRRVEISSTTADLTAPVKIENRQAVSVGATTVRYDMTVTPDPSVHTYTGWTITLDKDGVQLGTPLTGTGAPPASTTQDLTNASQYAGQPVHYTLTVTDEQGQTAHAEGYTRIESKTVDHNNLEKYGMLSFDFDKADINDRARQMLSLISESISNGATGVNIDGYCDATGTPEYNQTLSEARANAAVTALRSMTSLPSNVTVRGHGLRDPRFTNDLPEGRQLNRRVEFTIEKSSQ